jgi:hypothetical protein
MIFTKFCSLIGLIIFFLILPAEVFGHGFANYVHGAKSAAMGGAFTALQMTQRPFFTTLPVSYNLRELTSLLDLQLFCPTPILKVLVLPGSPILILGKLPTWKTKHGLFPIFS